MKIHLASVSFTTPYTPQRRFLSLGYLHAYAVTDDVIGPATEIVHEYYDPSIRSAEEIADAICAQQPDLVGFTCYVWNTQDVLAVCEHIRRLRPSIKLILGGPEVSYKYVKVLDANPCIDWICVNEGEETFREFLRAWLTEGIEATSKIAGLACRDAKGVPNLPEPRGYLKELDKLPSPYLTGVLDVCDIRGGANYQTARGCPFTCSYCDYGRNQPYFEFSLERVEAEMKYFKEHNARILFNVDPTFNYNRKRAEAILDTMIRQDIKAIHWFEVFPSLINQDLIELLEKSHLSFMGVGIQSANPETMRNIKRVWRPEKVAPLLDSLKFQSNIMLSYEIIMGLPGDSVQDYVDTMSWTYNREPADIKSFNLAILPRTPLEKETEKWGIDFDPDIGHEILKTDFMSRQDVLIGKAINDWHRIMQKAFFQLHRVAKAPAGELLREWAWKVFHAGHHERIGDLNVHRIDTKLVEDLAELWREFTADVCARVDVPDISAQMKDMLRYMFFRRSRTWASAFFADVRDIYFNEPYPHLHRFYSVTNDALPEPSPDALAQKPQLGGEVDFAQFEFGMDELYPLQEAADIAAVQPDPRGYVFFMTPDHGAGCGIIVDELSRAFLELADGETTVEEIGRKLGTQFDARAAGLAPALYTAFAATGIFDRPRFLTDFEDGKITWQSCFPETFRAYH